MFPAASPEPTLTATPGSVSRVDTISALVLVLAYAIVQVMLFAGHAPWRDEAQAWLWAQQLSTPAEFLAVPGEGHPPLWFWLLRVLSYVVDFNHARILTLAVALLNAALLMGLLRGKLLLLVLILSTHVVLQYWGYHFRPYGLVFTAILTALLLDRAGRGIAATWVLAIACGLHFFAGLLFGFYLLLQLQRRTPMRHLIGPAILASLFGLSAIISGMGNPEADPSTTHFLDTVIYNFAWPAPWPFMRTLPVALATVALLCLGLWRSKFILAAVLGLTLAFAIGGAMFYGQSPWHSAFLMMLTFMAFTLAGSNSRSWVLLVLLVPQAIGGIAMTKVRFDDPVWSRPDVYAAVVADAGQGFNPAAQLVAWPDYMLSSAAAVRGITYRSGNNGQLLGPVDWRKRRDGELDPILGTHATPYWLVCGNCQPALAAIADAGMTATALASSTGPDDGPTSAYRIER